MSLNYLMRIVDLENSVKQKTITITQLRNAIEEAWNSSDAKVVFDKLFEVSE